MIKQIFKKSLYMSVIGAVILTICAVSVCRAQKVDRKKMLEAEKKKEMIKLAKEELNNTIWEVELRYIEANTKKKNAKKKEEMDILRFEGNKIASDKMLSEGFNPSNYTIRLKGKDNEKVIWETMQTSEENGIAFWRGEIREGDMRGVLSWHVSEKQKKDYTFTSKAKEEVMPEPEVAEEEIMPEPVVVEEEIEEVVVQAAQEEEEPVRETIEEEANVLTPEPEVKEAPKKEEKKPWWQR